MIKAIKIFIFFIILLVVFSKQIISHTSLYFFSKLIDREIVVDEFQINYRQNSIFINNFKIMNPKEFYYDNFVELKKILLNYNFKSLFSDLIIINNLTLENPMFYLEVLEKPSQELSPSKKQQNYEDNVGAVNKIVKSKPRKIWSPKDRDKNFLILKVKINNAKAFIKTPISKVPTKIDLSDIFFSRVGNGSYTGEYFHHKAALKKIVYDMIGNLADLELKNFLKKIYNYKNLYMY